MRIVTSSGGCIPIGEESTFLRACFCEPQVALRAWQDWRATHDLDALDEALFRLLPAVYPNLQHAGYDGADLTTLKGLFLRNWYVGQKLFHAVEQVLRHLHEAEIPTLLFKGVALAHLFYPAPAMRFMVDGDIAVAPRNADAAITVLRSRGWSQKEPLKQDYKHTSHSVAFVNGQGQEIDLHWHLFRDGCGEHDDEVFWQRAVPLVLRSAETLTLTTTDHLLHTCIHGYEWNAVHSLRWIADAGFLLNHPSSAIDWQYLVAQVQSRQWTLRLLGALRILRHRYAVPIPAEVLECLAATRVSRFERREHDVMIQHQQHRLRWVLRAWHRQRRYYADRSFAERALTFPMVLSNEFALSRTEDLPAEVLRRLYAKLACRLRRWST